MDLTLDEVSKMLNISTTKVKNLADEGKIPSYWLGGKLRFDLLEIEDWVIRREEKLNKSYASSFLLTSFLKIKFASVY